MHVALELFTIEVDWKMLWRRIATSLSFGVPRPASFVQLVRGIQRHQLHVTQGLDRISIYGDDAAHDAHCATCGSLLYSVVRGGAYVHVAMGTLVEDPTIRPSIHIFVGSKASWFDITDDLPQFEALPDAR